MKKPILLAALLALLSSPALAGDGGLYLGLHGGGLLLDESENENEGGTFNLEFDPGWMGGVSFGYDLRDSFPEVGTGRVELEASWRENDLDQAAFATGDSPATGSATVASVMLNTIGEYRGSLPWIPYIGAGAGAARITLDKVAVSGGTNPLADDDDTVFAYQGMAGVAWQVASRFYLDLGYRYFALLEPEFTDANGEKFESEYVSHNLTFGMRIDF